MGEATFRTETLADGRRVIVPADADAAEMLAALPASKPFMGAFKARRNPQHHRLLFAMLRDVCEAGAWEGDTDSLLLWLKLRCRLVDVHVVDGRPLTVARSIAFASMDQAAFRRFFDRACYHVCDELLAGRGLYHRLWTQQKRQPVAAA